MASQLGLIELLEKIIVLPAAPWVLRIALYYEGINPQWPGFTHQGVINEIRQKFKHHKFENPPSDERVKEDLSWLRSQGLIDENQGTILLSVRGRLIAEELTLAVSNV